MRTRNYALARRPSSAQRALVLGQALYHVSSSRCLLETIALAEEPTPTSTSALDLAVSLEELTAEWLAAVGAARGEAA